MSKQYELKSESPDKRVKERIQHHHKNSSIDKQVTQIGTIKIYEKQIQ